MIFGEIAEEFNPSQIKLIPDQKASVISNMKKQLESILNILFAFLSHQYSFVASGEFKDESSKKLATLTLRLYYYF